MNEKGSKAKGSKSSHLKSGNEVRDVGNIRQKIQEKLEKRKQEKRKKPQPLPESDVNASLSGVNELELYSKDCFACPEIDQSAKDKVELRKVLNESANEPKNLQEMSVDERI